MTESFGRSAVRLAAYSVRTLGWRPHEFWAATPSEFATSLGLVDAEPEVMLDRGQLQRLMEREHDRPG